MKQENKNKNFSVKKLLTTASAFAVIASAASDAAANRYTHAVGVDRAQFINGVEMDNKFKDSDGTPSNDPAAPEHSIFFSRDDTELDLGSADGTTPGSTPAIDLGGRENLTINVRGRTAIGAVVNTGYVDAAGDVQNAGRQADLNVEGTLLLQGVDGEDKDGNPITTRDYTAVETVILADGSSLEASQQDLVVEINDVSAQNALVTVSNNAQLTVNDITGDDARAEVSGDAQLTVNDIDGARAQVSASGNAQLTVNHITGANARSEVSENAQLTVQNLSGALEIKGQGKAEISGASTSVELSGADAEVKFTGNSDNSGEVVVDGDAQGVVHVEGSRRFSNIGAADHAARAVNFTAAGSRVENGLHAQTVNVREATNLGGTVRVDALNLDGAAASVNLPDNAVANSVTTQGNNEGTLEVGANVQMQDVGAAGNRLAEVNFTAADSSVTNNLHAAAVNVREATTLGGQVQSDDFTIRGDHQLTLEDGAQVDAHIKTENNEEGTLEVGANVRIQSIGAADADPLNNRRLAQVDLAADSSVTNNLHAQTVNVNGATTLGGEVQSDDFTIRGDHQLTLEDGAQVDAHIQTENDGQGGVAFNGSATVSQNIGTDAEKLRFVDIAAAVNPAGTMPSNPKVVLNADNKIFTQSMRVENSALELKTPAEITSDNTRLIDATIDLASHTLTHDGNITFENGGTNTLKFDLSGDEDALNGGTLVVNGDVTFAGDSTLILTPTDTGINKKPGSHTYALMTATNIDLDGRDISDVISYSPGAFYKWKVELVNDAAAGVNRVNLLTQDISLAYLKNKIKGDEKNLAKVANATDGVALKLKDLWNNIATGEEDGSVKAGTLQEAHNRVINGHTGASDNAANNVSGAENVVETRTFSLRALPAVRTTASAGHVTGVAAGDDADQYGVWVNPFYANLTQGARGEAAGYNSQSYGSGFGMDTKVDDDVTLGLAVTLSATDTKHKDFKDGDKTKVKSAMVSVYNMYDFAENWFTSGSATIGASKVHNYAKKLVSATDYRTAEAKYTIKAYSIKQMVGYNYGIESATFTPMLGLRFARVDAVKYQETGFSSNASISANAVNRLETVAGISVAGAACHLDCGAITPEAHAFVNYNLLGKKQKTTVKFGSTEFESINNPQRLSANVGVGLRFGHDEFEYEAAYDLQLAKKRVGHQGALKLRMNF